MEKRLSKVIDYDVYGYIINNPLFLRSIYLFGIISWFFVLVGYRGFLNLNPVYWIIFGPILGTLTIYNVLNYGVNLFYKKFDLKQHERLKNIFWKKTKTLPLIDIFLPVCGEDLRIIKNTYSAVQNILYTNKKVYVLDDMGDPKIKKLASEFGFIYLTRPNKGYMRKAGNLRYGFEHSQGEFYVVFDADFAPHPEFVHELLPYMLDKKVGIVQSPQYFETQNGVHKRSPIEYGAAYMQEDFYRILQQSKDTFGGSMCIGSNAIYRRTAVKSFGGPPLIDHGEDVFTGVEVLIHKYKIKYVPLILAKGLCPDTLTAFHKMHNRWCSSSMGLLISNKIITSNLTVVQKLCYFTGFLYYICDLFFFLMPLQLFLLLGFHGERINMINAIPFFPHIFFSFILLPMLRINKPKLGAYLAAISSMYTHSLTAILRFFGRSASWVPTNAIEHGVEKGFEFLNNFSILFIGVYLSVVSLLIFTYHLPFFNWTFYSVIFWIIWNLLIHLYYSFSTYSVIYAKKAQDALLHANYKKDFDLWRTRTFGTFAIVVVMVFTSTGYSLQSSHGEALYATRSVVLARLNKVNTHPTKTIASKKIEDQKKVVLGTDTTNYTITAKPYDSQTILAREAIVQFSKDRNLQLETYQRVYIETNLVHNHYQVNLNPGDTIKYSTDEIQKLVDQSKNLDSVAVHAWQQYQINY